MCPQESSLMASSSAEGGLQYSLAPLQQLMNFSCDEVAHQVSPPAIGVAPEHLTERTIEKGASSRKLRERTKHNQQSIHVLSPPPSLYIDDEPRYLGTGYKLNSYDVMCGRGKGTLENEGNIKFRQIVASYLEQFVACKKRVHKQACIAEIIDTIRSADGHFLKYDRTTHLQWYDIGDKNAAAKIGHCLRDLKTDSRKYIAKTKKKVDSPVSKKHFGEAKRKKAASVRTEDPDFANDFGGFVFHPIEDQILDSLGLLSFTEV